MIIIMISFAIGQQHPRLARGESYSCGYKPYRCEICNYSTTTKGNLSIHMQSDKHLNNMQEINSSQNMVAAAVVAAGGVPTVGGNLEATSKLNLTTSTSSHQQHQQPSISINNSKCSNTATFTASNTISGSTNNTALTPGGNPLNSNVGNVNSNSGGLHKTKPSFRCDICSYETSVARNLRIHMTSEKHMHNLTVLQNNIKHIHAFTFLQQQQQQQQQQNSCFIPEVALADLAYNQALMIQFLHQNAAIAASQCQSSLMPSPALPTSSKGFLQIVGNNHNATLSKPQEISPIINELQLSPFSTKPPCSDLGSSDGSMTMESPPYIPDPWPTMLYSCLVCSNFNTNNLDELNQHLLVDRSRQPVISGLTPNVITSATDPYATSSLTEVPNINSSGGSPAITTASVNVSSASTALFSDIMVIQNNNYICRLCNYKTNLKANFQLHSKTDKHLQKLSFINHVREGGKRNEHKLKFYQKQQQQIGSNSVQIKCNCCDFYTNSIQKLSLHTQHMRHDAMLLIFKHLNSLIYEQQKHRQQQEKKQQEQRMYSKSNSKENESYKSSSPSLKSTSAITTTAATGSLPDAPATQNILCCQVCNFSALSLLEMLQHVKSLRHLQVEQFACLQRRSEQLEKLSVGEMFKLNEESSPCFDRAICQQQQVQSELLVADDSFADNDEAIEGKFGKKNIHSSNIVMSKLIHLKRTKLSLNFITFESQYQLRNSTGAAKRFPHNSLLKNVRCKLYKYALVLQKTANNTAEGLQREVKGQRPAIMNNFKIVTTDKNNPCGFMDQFN
uniref:C2H2-type domain-containing protein n=1 Tax=Glossina palpalis gambiensis TaxID=67801 RepID=A0A1B0AXX1_9MUSC